jgi:hypothetical protein
MRDILITAEHVELVRDAGSMYVGSHEIPGCRDDRQPHEWHDGKKLLALADTLERLLKLKVKRGRR